MKTRTLALWILSFVLLAGSQVGAQPRGQSAEARAARAHAKRAAIHYELGRYAAALDEYGRAHDLAPVPELLFNMGQCHFQLRSYQQAILFYQAYLADRPDAHNRDLVIDLIAEAEAEVEQQRSQILVATGSSHRDQARPVYRRWWFWAAVGTAALAAVGTTMHLTADDDAALPARSLGVVDAR